MEKRIAFFVGCVRTEYHYKITEEMERLAYEKGYKLEIFQNFELFNSNILFGYGEKELAELPDLSQYDAIGLAPDTFLLSGYEEALLSKFKTISGIPIVSIRKEVDGLYNILLNDYNAIYGITEHCITHHGKRKIAFMKGKESNKDARVRYRAFEDAMMKYGLKIKPEFIYQGNFWKNHGSQAVDHFLSGRKPPEVIICANDYMAISVMEELQKRGIRVPEDIMVTGYDNTNESMSITPGLTTASMNYAKMASCFYNICENIWTGNYQKPKEYVNMDIIYRGSCGCEEDTALWDRKKFFNDYMVLTDTIIHSSFLYLSLDNIKTPEDMYQNLKLQFYNTRIPNNFYFCLNDPSEDEDEIAFTDTMILKSIVSMDTVKFPNEKFCRADILPLDYKTSESLTVINLHIKDRCFGYMVIEGKIGHFLAYFLQILTQSIVNWYEKYELSNTNKELTNEVTKDALTKIANRKVMDAELTKAYVKSCETGESFFICSVDMDDLKGINDTLGHQQGDEAIKAVANILHNTCKDIGIASRIGGDEFMICYKTNDESLVKQNTNLIRQRVEEYNDTKGKSYTLSISIGFKECNKYHLITDCIRESDNLMYAEKRRKKKNREREKQNE